MAQTSAFSSFLTVDPLTCAAIKTAEKAAPTDVNILITGESGTGKNVLSEAIHLASTRRFGPFIPVNCMAIPDTLIESELFGHEKGAFTDAYAQKRGSFECADQGTLYLDEIGDMVPAAQGKILTAIEDKRFKRVGGEKYITTDARIVSATNRNLETKVRERLFRDDLYYRLKEVSLHLSPLRERKDDIPLMLNYYVAYYCKTYGKPDLKISKAALAQLVQYSWPGNIRELKSVVKSAVIFCDQEELWLEHFPFEIMNKLREEVTPHEDFSLEGILKRHIASVLQHHHWNKRRAAATLRISRPRLDRYVKKYGLKKEDL